MSYVYVYDGSVVNIDVSTTGEKTIASFTFTDAPAGTYAIIVMVSAEITATDGGMGKLLLYRDTTQLYVDEQTRKISSSNTGEQDRTTVFIALDTSAPASPSYTVKVNITTAVSATVPMEVKAMAICLNNIQYSYTNSSAVSVSTGSIVTIASLSTSLPAGKRVVMAPVNYLSNGTPGSAGEGNIRLKKGTTVVSSNQFAVWTYNNCLAPILLIYLDDATDANPTYSVEVYGSPNGGTVDCQIFAFLAGDAYFLDGGSVVIGTSETTLGSLSTAFSQGIDVYAIAAFQLDNTTSATIRLVNAGYLRLQQNNSTTGQIVNDTVFGVRANAGSGDGSTYGLLGKFTTSTASPSFQAKATGTARGVNGEVKIIVFQVVIIEYKNVSDSASFTDAVSVSSAIYVSDSMQFTDSPRSDAEIYASDGVSFTEEITSPKQVYASDSVSFTEEIKPLEMYVSDSVSFTETVRTQAEIPIHDTISFTEMASRTEPIQAVSDTVRFSEVIHISRNIQRLQYAKRLVASKRVISTERVEEHRRLGP